MGKFERILAAISALPEKRREEIAAILEELFHGDIHANDYTLSDEQIADLQRRVAEPGDIASDAETEAFFAVEPFHSSLCHMLNFSHFLWMHDKHLAVSLTRFAGLS